MDTTNKSQRQQSTKPIAATLIFIISVMVLILFGAVLLMKTWKVSMKSTEAEAIQLAEAAEAGIPKSYLLKLSADSNDINKQEYNEIKHMLTSFVALKNNVRFSYILVKKGEKLYFLADSESVESKDYSPPGQEYTEANEDCFIPFKNGETLLTKPAADRWGKWVSVLVPMKKIDTGETIAVFGVDYPAETWNNHAVETVLQAGVVVLCMLIIIFIFYYALAQNKVLRREKKKLLQSEAKLKESETLFRAIFDQASIGIAIGHNEKCISLISNNIPSINPMFEKVTGRTKEELESIRWADITHPDDLQEDLDKFEQFKAGQISRYDMEKRYIKPDGSSVWVHMIISPLYFSYSTDLKHLCLVEDISGRKEQEMKLKYISEHDCLTGLYNRISYENIIEQELKSNREYKSAVVLVNIRKFSLVNITYGYQYAESMIKELAEGLSKLIAANRQLFHISIDRFAFYVTNYNNKNELSELCERIKEIINSLITLNNIQGSIGIVELENYKGEADSILKFVAIAADQASENQNRGYCYYNKNMEEKILRKEAIKEELAKALRNEEDDSIYLEYQPIVELSTNKIYGFEALSRFRCERLGYVSPAEFIPMAEETQLIVPLGRKIMLNAFRFLKVLEGKGYNNIAMSFNVSVIQLLRDDFLTDLIETINEVKISPSNLNIEITESVFSSNYEEINEKLGRIKELGIKVALDDFGTGYSSLARERELNINCMKIDKYFVDNLLILDTGDAITGDIISIAHKLGHYVVAEGIEHDEQKQYLIEHKCDYMQGYLFSKPLSLEAAIELLKCNRLNEVKL